MAAVEHDDQWFERYLELRLEDEAVAADLWSTASDALRRRFASRRAALESIGLLAAVEGEAETWNPPSVEGYEVVAHLGAGGGGTVFVGRQESLGREVAIKFLSPRPTIDGNPQARFAREAAILARVRSPHVVEIFDYGVADSWPYLVMALVPGRSLAHEVRERGPAGDREAIRAAVRTMATLARAVQVLHRAGIVHRDLKPSNVLRDPDGNPILIDFGLALDSAAVGLDRTRTGHILGTPAYAAPEQIDGAGCDHRADIFGLGATLFHLLTGTTPIGAPSLDAIRREYQSHGARNVRAFNREVDRDLAAVVSCATATRAADRYQSCAAFIDDLESWLDGVRPRAARRRPIRGAARWVRRNPTRTALLVTLPILAVLGRSTVLAESRRLEQIEGERVKSLSQLVDAELAIGTGDAAAQALDELARLRPRDPDVAFARVRVALDGPGNFDPGRLARSPARLAALRLSLAEAEALLSHEPCWEPLIRLESLLASGRVPLPRVELPELNSDLPVGVARRAIVAWRFVGADPRKLRAAIVELFKRAPNDVRVARMAAFGAEGAEDLVSLAAASSLRALDPERGGSWSIVLFTELRYLRSLGGGAVASEIDRLLAAADALVERFPMDREVLFHAADIASNDPTPGAHWRAARLYERCLALGDAPEVRINLGNIYLGGANRLTRWPSSSGSPIADIVRYGCGLGRKQHLLLRVEELASGLEAYRGQAPEYWTNRSWTVFQLDGPKAAARLLGRGLEWIGPDADELWLVHLMRAEFALDALDQGRGDPMDAAAASASLRWLADHGFPPENGPCVRIFQSAGRHGEPTLARDLWDRLDAETQTKATPLYELFLAPLLDEGS
ncbi:Serine/threonine-protein kinase StkP [Planctomycetes bacterium Pla86]|uniref:Serine/threonine-protein kinase StkP n=2 Tax=Engelhardtia mirabilis TaxID=2528011 RepID=A0A518BNV1_9BACT|nr:Serine/threonine-protein kinase StkP [Planctomycetes bacterium Pla133]QDV02981.1 Serine/threonine-protein kinase StkP [Planctomycetes bacterium Pla86]